MVGITSFWKSVNFRLNQALNFVLHKFQDTLPDEGVEGQVAYCEGHVYYHDGTQWVLMGNGDVSQTVVFNFTSDASQEWVVQHNLGRLVHVQTMDADGHEIFGSVTWDLETLDTVTVEFSEPVTGYVIVGYGIGSEDERVWSFVNQSVWTISHSFDRLVAVQTMDAEGHEITGTVEWDLIGGGTVRITFSEPTTGTAILI